MIDINKALKHAVLVGITTTFFTACGGGSASPYQASDSTNKDNAQSSKVSLKDILLDSKETKSVYQMLMFKNSKTLVLNKNELYDISEPKLKKLPSLDVPGEFRGLSQDDNIFYSGKQVYNYRTDISNLNTPKPISDNAGKDSLIKNPVKGLLYINESGFPHYNSNTIFSSSNDGQIRYLTNDNIFKITDTATGTVISQKEFHYDIDSVSISDDKHFAYIIEKYTGLKIADISDIHNTLPLVGQLKVDLVGATLSADNKTLYAWGVTTLHMINVEDSKDPKIIKTIDTGDYFIRRFIPNNDDSRGYFLSTISGTDTHKVLAIKL